MSPRFYLYCHSILNGPLSHLPQCLLALKGKSDLFSTYIPQKSTWTFSFVGLVLLKCRLFQNKHFRLYGLFELRSRPTLYIPLLPLFTVSTQQTRGSKLEAFSLLADFLSRCSPCGQLLSADNPLLPFITEAGFL